MRQFPLNDLAVAGDDDHRSSPPSTSSSPVLVSVRGSRSHSSCRRVTPAITSGSERVERLLPNGDLYTGSFDGSVPHGVGKYLWKDGCMYEGEWRRGKAAGKGKFSWPSGATFEGEFRAGRMDGLGTFTGSDGDTYTGSWVADRKHGCGQKSYANGDYYEGFWRRNLQDGQGRYVWRNGNEYVGEWRSGVISGRGVLIWANGNRYDGHWENGVPKGSGVFTWPDGSCYIGNWCRDPDYHLNGTYYPATNSKEPQPRFLTSPVDDNRIHFSSRKRSSVDGAARGSVVERNYTKMCIWDSDGDAGDITCDIIDNVQASLLCHDDNALDDCVSISQRRRSPFCYTGEVKKPGQTISKGHKNYDLMICLQKGISYSIGKTASGEMRGLRQSDFDPREKFWTRFPIEGSKLTHSHNSVEFRWKDYCPMVFRHLRKLFAVDPADYMLAICGNDALRELSSPGKSGSFFYLTQDDRFMIKTVKKSEVKLLLRMLQSYYQHVSQYRSSLVTKFYGVHCVKPLGGQKVRFIVMGNLFCSEYRIHRRFDLKGSSHGRTTDKAEEDIDETTTLKDLDLNFVFRMQRFWYEDLLSQIKKDCEFLEAEGIMDYSLLVGVHFCDDLPDEKMRMASPFVSYSKKDSYQGGKGLSKGCFLVAEGRDLDSIMPGWKPMIRLGANMPARAETVMRSDYDRSDPFQSAGGNLTPGQGNFVYEVILYFGIIDILQDYDISKKIEHAYKSLQVDPTSISAVDPKLYSKRFKEFISRVFVEETER